MVTGAAGGVGSIAVALLAARFHWERNHQISEISAGFAVQAFVPLHRGRLRGSGAIPDKWMFVWQNEFLGSMPPRSPPRALERSLLFWSAV